MARKEIKWSRLFYLRLNGVMDMKFDCNEEQKTPVGYQEFYAGDEDYGNCYYTDI